MYTDISYDHDLVVMHNRKYEFYWSQTQVQQYNREMYVEDWKMS